MDIKYEDSDIYYQEKSEFIKSVFTWNLFFSAIMMIFIKQLHLYNMILGVIRLLIAVTLLMFITHSDNINPKPIKRIVKLNIIIIIIVSGLEIVPLEFLESIKYFFIIEPKNNYVDHGNIYFFIMYYMLAKYRYAKGENIINEYKAWLVGILVINIIGNLYIDNSLAILITNKIITEILLILAIKNIYKVKILNCNKVNILEISAIISFICINIMDVCRINKLYLSFLILANFNFAIVMAVLTGVIDNISKNMYSFIFKDIYDVNKRLGEINHEISIRNKELEKFEVEIERKQKSYRDLLNSLPKSIIIVSTANNRIIYCNPDFQNLIGIKNVREILNKKVENIIKLNFEYESLKDLSRSEVYFGNNILNNEKQLEIRLGNYNKNKEEITMIFEDITEKIKIEKLKGEIEKNKINDNIKKNFLSNVSHDFKIPINVIYSATQLQNLLITNNDVEAVKKYNDISKQNCLILIKLTNNIIDISKITSEHMNTTLKNGNIVEFLEDKVNTLVEYAILSKINIIFDTDKEELYMKYDKELMERILLNLVSNAVKFTPENGIINVDIKHNEENIFISVKDTGIGMDEYFAKEAFNKYSMNLGGVQGNTQGTGIGLYVVYNLVNLQKGEIWVESQIGKGAKFTMKFCKEQFYGVT